MPLPAQIIEVPDIPLPEHTEPIAYGSECQVYATKLLPDVVLKLYYAEFNETEVSEVIRINRKYAKQGLAPNVLSNVIEFDDEYPSRFGYLQQRVYFDDLYGGPDNRKDEANLADALGFTDIPGELKHNWGYTENGKAVMYDFGRMTLRLIGISE